MTKIMGGFLLSVALGYVATLMYLLNLVENTLKKILIP